MKLPPGTMKIRLFLLLAAPAAPLVLVCASANGEAAYLSSPLKFPVMIEGKTVGSTTLAAGARVEILSREGDRVLVKAAAGEAWAQASQVADEIPDTGSNPATQPALAAKEDDNRAPAEPHDTAAGEPVEPVAPVYSAKPDNPEIPATTETEPPAGFAWDRTLIIPGRFAYLNLPFIKQTKPGICVGASAINIVRYLCPDNQLSAGEFFHLITERAAGAGDIELLMGMKMLGLPAYCSGLSRANVRADLKRLKTSLDNNLPVLAADRRHMVVITGYNDATKKIFVWNQWGNGKIVNGMPKGHYELLDTDLPIEFNSLIYCHKVRYEPEAEAKTALESVTGATEDLQLHPYIEGPIPFSAYNPHAGPERLKAALRANRTVLVPKGDSVLCVIPGEAKDTSAMQCVTLPRGVKTQMSLQALSDVISRTAAGNFYSAKSAEKLAASSMP